MESSTLPSQSASRVDKAIDVNTKGDLGKKLETVKSLMCEKET